MSIHKRVDSAVVSMPTNITDTAKLDFSKQTQQVQEFLESARSLVAQEGCSILQTLLDRVGHLERALQEKDTILDGCKHFNKELNATNESLEAREKANTISMAEIMTECEILRNTGLENGKGLQAALSEKQNLETALENVRRQLKEEKDTTKKLHDTVNDRDNSLATRAAEVEQLRTSGQALNKRYKKADLELSQMRRFTIDLQDEDQGKMTERMGTLWQRVTSFVLDHFCKDIPLPTLTDGRALHELKAAVPNIPLPSSNSPAAKQMRFVAIVTIIVDSMYNHLFQPTYILGEGAVIQDALVEQAEHDLNQEQLCRRVLLAMLPDAAQKDTQDRIDQVVTDVTDIVKSLSTKGDADFRNLRDCVEGAYKIWDATRKMKPLYHLSFERYHQDDPDWATIDLPKFKNDKVQQPVAVHDVNDDVVLQVFPRVYVSEKPLKQLNAGIALRRYQTLAAKKEYDEEAPNRGTDRLKPTSSRARKRSVAHPRHSGVQR